MLLANLLPHLFKGMTDPSDCRSLALLSELSLGLFLAMSLMSMQLWTLVELALPILGMLLVQVVVMVTFCYLLLFPMLGKNYDSAVMCAGYMGNGPWRYTKCDCQYDCCHQALWPFLKGIYCCPSGGCLLC